MRRLLSVLLFVGGLFFVTNVMAQKADELRVLMRDANGAILASDFKQAISFCDQALAIDVNFAEAYANRAEAKGMMEDFDGALADANKAIELAPNQATIHPAYYTRAVIALDYASEPEKALEFMNKAIELKSDDSFYYQFRGEIHEKLGHKDLAEADYAKSDSAGQ